MECSEGREESRHCSLSQILRKPDSSVALLPQNDTVEVKSAGAGGELNAVRQSRRVVCSRAIAAGS